MGPIIGIDLGTVTTVAAVAKASPQVLINGMGSRQTPSMVGFTRKGDRVVGEFAKRQLMSEPERTLHSLRRFLGRPYDEAWEDIRRVSYPVEAGARGGVAIRAGEERYTPEALMAMVLSAVKHSAEQVLGEEVHHAVITTPINFTTQQRQGIRDAGTLAGFNVLRLISEPIAAALAYLSENPAPATLAIYDLGGASFDFTLIRADASGLRTLATAGLSRLGGWDLDLRIIQWLIEEFFTRHLIDVSREPMAMQRLRDAAERAKQELSSAESTEIRLPFLTADDTGPKHIEKTLTRAEFESMVEDLLQRTLIECDTAMHEAKLEVGDIDALILVGGSAQIPKVQAMVSEQFEGVTIWSKSPEESVALGAATQAFLFKPKPPPEEGEVTAVAIGVEGPAGQFIPLIKAGTPLPINEIIDLSIQGSADAPSLIHILQGAAPRVEDNQSLGYISLSASQSADTIRLHISLESPTPQEDDDPGATLTITALGGESTTDGESEAPAPAQDDTPPALIISPFYGLIKAERAGPASEDTPPEELTDEDRELLKLRETLATHLASLEQVQRDFAERLSARELSELDAALKRGRVAVNKTAERPAYFQEMTEYIFQFYTNLSAKLS